MARVIALLRGVNIGKRRVSMVDIRDGLERAGCRNVVTYVQSGNVVLTPPAKHTASLRSWLETTLGEIAGFDIPVVLRTATELAAVVKGNPYPEASGTLLHVSFYAETPRTDLLDAIDRAQYAPEKCMLFGRDMYLLLPDGMGNAKLPADLEKANKRKPAVLATTRNWNTVLKLLELASE
jgi:uncharacterized protein (DUF1697 family)